MSTTPVYLGAIEDWHEANPPDGLGFYSLEIGQYDDGKIVAELFRGTKNMLPNDGCLSLSITIDKHKRVFKIEDVKAYMKIGSALSQRRSMLPAAIAYTPEAIKLLEQNGSFFACIEKQKIAEETEGGIQKPVIRAQRGP